MAFLIRTGPGGIAAMMLFIPLIILLAIFLPILIIAVLLIAAAVGVPALLFSKIKTIGKKQGIRTKKTKGIIDVEYKIK